jgi:hypothetical protein
VWLFVPLGSSHKGLWGADEPYKAFRYPDVPSVLRPRNQSWAFYQEMPVKEGS